ncbi:MAG: DUF488 family protein [Acidimicrobiia bacterium]|nr:DUF488 family protein [Acidimicrobiia bacterium]
MTNQADIHVGRVYDDRPDKPGTWVLVDRLWPRGISKKDEPWDEWAKNVAPSTQLRKWYQHDDSRFDEFARRYRAELEAEPAADAFQRLILLAQAGPLTLLTASKDVEHSDAEVLRDALLDGIATK